MERRRLRFGTHRDKYNCKLRKGYKLPNINEKEVKKLIDELNCIPF